VNRLRRKGVKRMDIKITCPECGYFMIQPIDAVKLPAPGTEEYQKIGDIIRDYHLKQCESPSWVLPVFKHTDSVLALMCEGK